MINDDFTKTGSGQTQGKHSKTDYRFLAGLWRCQCLSRKPGATELSVSDCFAHENAHLRGDPAPGAAGAAQPERYGVRPGSEPPLKPNRRAAKLLGCGNALFCLRHIVSWLMKTDHLPSTKTGSELASIEVLKHRGVFCRGEARPTHPCHHSPSSPPPHRRLVRERSRRPSSLHSTRSYV